MVALGERQLIVDCDVLQADGGTRTASICGGYLALHDALTRVVQNKLIPKHPLHSHCAAISVGIVDGAPALDLPYVEDSKAEVDMNVVMLSPVGGGEPRFVEVQGTAEAGAFSRSELDALLDLASGGLEQLFVLQSEMVSVEPPARKIGR
jgi:ribonuclease PH